MEASSGKRRHGDEQAYLWEYCWTAFARMRGIIRPTPDKLRGQRNLVEDCDDDCLE